MRIEFSTKFGVRVHLHARPAKRRRGEGGVASEPVPVEPDRPHTLSGGAAAALEFGG